MLSGCAGAVIDAAVDDIHCDELVQKLKAIKPTLTVIAITGHDRVCEAADHQLVSFEPAKLLELLKQLDEAACKRIEAREQQLHSEGR